MISCSDAEEEEEHFDAAHVRVRARAKVYGSVVGVGCVSGDGRKVGSSVVPMWDLSVSTDTDNLPTKPLSADRAYYLPIWPK